MPTHPYAPIHADSILFPKDNERRMQVEFDLEMLSEYFFCSQSELIEKLLREATIDALMLLENQPKEIRETQHWDRSNLVASERCGVKLRK